MNNRCSIKPLSVLMLGILASGVALADETVFYRNTTNPNALLPTTPIYYGTNTKGYEWADDIPFTGTQRVSSFKIGYKSPEPVHATFRFYGVDPSSGLPGTLIAEFSRDLPAGEDTPTIVLNDSEKFAFTAEPNLFNQNRTGGWFSIRFKSLVDDSEDAQFRMAGYTSLPNVYNVDTGKIGYGTLTDPDGTTFVSTYLEVKSDLSVDTAAPALNSIALTPNTIKAGDSGSITIRLESQAPQSGVKVHLTSSLPSIVYVPATVTIPAGSTGTSVTYSTKRRAPHGSTAVTITAETDTSSASAVLTVIR